ERVDARHLPAAYPGGREEMAMAIGGVRHEAPAQAAGGRVRCRGPGQRRGRCGDRASSLSASESAQDRGAGGEGICFDTRGHNVKPERYMQGMHEDMNGSAVALGILLAATQAKVPVNLDCWMAIAQNSISPRAYRQNEIVTALNGTTIEVVHTDAEGRMVLAD